MRSRVEALNANYFAVTRTSDDGTLTILAESYTASNFAIAAGTRNYTLPPDFIEMLLIESITSGYETTRFIHRDLASPDMRSLLEITDNQSPSDFVFDIVGERTMRIAPLSDTALALRITYTQEIAELTTDADTMTMPYPLHLAVIDFATGYALRQDRNPDAASYEASADKLVAEFFGSHERQSQDQSIVRGYLNEWTGW